VERVVEAVPRGSRVMVLRFGQIRFGRLRVVAVNCEEMFILAGHLFVSMQRE